jgi:hypothetical protein
LSMASAASGAGLTTLPEAKADVSSRDAKSRAKIPVTLDLVEMRMAEAS